MLKTAKQWKESGSNAADTTPLANEPVDAVGDTLKGGMDDLAKVTQELEDLQTSLDSQMANLDPASMKVLEKELKAINEQADMAAADAQNLYKAAQAAAVCINKG
jgi:peptidoglycan hydrolase CwlO-like protein